MPITSALLTGLSGLQANSQMIDVSGNNISNVNTTAFKRSEIDFETQINRSLRAGSAPSGSSGGTNPAQTGLGVRLAAVHRDFTNGAIQPTGSNTDMAIDGDGFFVVEKNNNRSYTRNGNFSLDRDFNLVTSSGAKVQGWAVDDDYNIQDGVLTDMNLPVGVLSIAEPTTEVKFTGNLNSGGDVATRGSITAYPAFYTDAAGTVPATATTPLSSVFLADGSQPMAAGDVITMINVNKGGATIPRAAFEIGPAVTDDADAAGTTLQEYMDFLDNILGIDESAGTAGVRLNPDGEIEVESNVGVDNGIDLGNANFVINANTSSQTPMRFTERQAADGESTRTSFVAYDSLGNPVTVDYTLVLENKDTNGTQWRYFANSADDTDLDSFVGSGTINFSTDGELLTVDNPDILIDRFDTGALTPLEITTIFRDPFGAVTSLVDEESTLASFSQDGSPIGTLQDFDVSEDGRITGVFSNGLLRDMGQIPIATFANNNGLSDIGGSFFVPGSNSGVPVISAGGRGGAGNVIGRTIEASNVELSEEFVDLITASTGFSASSRVIQTSDELLQELLRTV